MRGRYADRSAAGEALAGLAAAHAWHRPVVVGVARGGVPVALPVARRLGASLDAVVARKIGAPGRPEFGVGAVCATGPPFFDDTALASLGLAPDHLASSVEAERAEAVRRERRYRAGRVSVAERDVILVDDGLATGVTAVAAIQRLRAHHPRRVAFAAPVCAPMGVAAIAAHVDVVICARSPARFAAVGEWYANFRQTTDDEVIAALASAAG
jgi:putative phosphoribosyl transferase